MTSEDPEVIPEVAELPLLPYLLTPREEREPLRDEPGDEPGPADQM